jgi:hypothetical protein
LDVLEDAVVAKFNADPATVIAGNGLVFDDALAAGSRNHMMWVMITGRYLMEGCGERIGLDVEKAGMQSWLESVILSWCPLTCWMERVG